MNSLYPRCRRIESAAELTAVAAALRADEQNLPFASHVIERGGEIIGAASLGVAPLVMVWTHSEKVRARDSLHLRGVYDSIMETKGFGVYLAACDKTCRYSPYMRRVGFKPFLETELLYGGVKV